ncbi:ACP S-malonyltransferase [Loigolactobacillus coryniformis]|uniref:[acyl-carrier-protein] S-malonyltransferase n=1 Tax=Loigolactobacillus coryniformis TaxID=1610 RepID=A0A5B8TEN9_9LACO|nr:acyltransferase domain-containing protein [Loigolactobacillus coryniformis]QEA52265.1 acyltransferase domain-containing protein [Loigolactobacillus coryniformis]RRG06941.1 MAG: acyltransferase domain-containing protein [Lactobacillus sp.]
MDALWIFPGQGGQYAGMLKQVPAALRQHVETLLDLPLLDTTAGYADSVQLQVSITLLQVAQVQMIQKMGFRPRLAAGHSLGVFAAAYALDCLALDDLFKIVKQRAELMQQAYPVGYGMGVIVGLTRAEVTQLVAQVTTTAKPVFVSNQNAEDQVALSGHLVAIDQVLELAKAQGAAKALRLNVPVPSHSPLMHDVAEKLQQSLAEVTFNRPHGIYLANDNGHAARQIIPVRRDLGDNLVHPVYFESMMAVATNYAPDVIINFAPGHPFKQVLAQKFDEQHQLYLAQFSKADIHYLLEKWERGSNL